MCTVWRYPMLMAGALVFLAGCAGGTGPEDKDRLDLTAQDNGTHVRMSVGDFLKITLEESPSMGAHWEVSDIDPDIMQYVDKTEEIDPACEPGAIGCPEMATLRFVAVGAGQCGLQLAYLRPGDNLPIDSFLVTLTVRN